MKKSNKIFSFLTLNLVAISALTGCNNKPIEHVNNALFLYISGGNLEKDAGFASKMINELKNYKSLNNLEIYGLAGGTSSWENDYFKDNKTCLFKIKNNEISILEESNKNLGKADTLSSFIDFTKTVKSSHKSLLFWGHGSPYGICNDSINNNDILTLSELNTGLKDSYFDYLIFNCCMGANIDLMSYVSDNAKYAIASEHNLPASGFDYSDILRNFNDDKINLEQKGKNIIDSTLKKYDNSAIKDKLTISLIDLNAFSKVVPTIEGLFFFTAKDPKQFYKNIREANNINDLGRDFIDIKGLNDYFGDNYKEELIPYEIHGNLLDTNGLYIYYREQISSKDLANYTSSAYYDDYFKLLKLRRDYNEEDFVLFESSKYEDSSLFAARVANIDYVSDFSYLIKDENGKIIKEDIIGLNTDFGNYSALDLYVNDDVLFSLNLDNLLLPVEIYSKQDTNNTDAILYKTNVILNGEKANLIIRYNYDDSDEFKGTYEILGATYFDESGASIQSVHLKNGDKIEVDGKSIIFNSQEIKRQPINSGNISFCVEDIYGKQYYSKELAIK